MFSVTPFEFYNKRRTKYFNDVGKYLDIIEISIFGF